MAARAHRQPTAGARRLALALVRALVAALVLAYVVRRIDLGGVWSSLRGVSFPAAFTAFAVWIVGWWIVSHRLALLMRAQGVAIGTFEALEINLATLFWGLLLPGGNLTGVVVRFYRLARAGGHYATGLLAMACDRIAATAAISLIGVACWAADGRAQASAGLAVLVVGMAMVAATAVPVVAADRLRAVARAFRARGLVALHAPLRRAWHAVDAIARLPARTLVWLLVLSCLAQGPGIAAYAILAHALGLSLSAATLGWVRSVALIVTALPISVGGLGVREGVLLLLLRPYGVADRDALAFSLLIFAVTVVGAGLLGGVLEAVRWIVPRRARAVRPSSASHR